MRCADVFIRSELNVERDEIGIARYNAEYESDRNRDCRVGEAVNATLTFHDFSSH